MLEASTIELAIESPERRVGRYAFGDFRVRKSEMQLLGLLIDCGLRDQLAKQLAIETAGTCFIGRDRPTDLTPQLLEAFIVELTELLDRNFGTADGCNRIETKSAENVADAPDRKTDDEKAHDTGHETFAEPR